MKYLKRILFTVITIFSLPIIAIGSIPYFIFTGNDLLEKLDWFENLSK